MGEEFGFEDIVQPDWLNEVSRFTDKHLLTHSEVSKPHFLDFDAEEEVEPYYKSGDKGYKQGRERNKCNAKNYRDRKRAHLESMKKQLDLLRQDNALLKGQKVCKSCSRIFQPNILASLTSEFTKEKENHRNCTKFSKDMEIEFQKPQLQKLIRRPKSPKVWIALGILFLVLGLTMHGINGGNNFISKINLERESMMKWKELVKQHDKSDYFSIDMNFQQSSKQSCPSDKTEDLLLHFESFTESKPQQKGQKMSVSKHFISSIQEQFDELGSYR